MHNWLPVAIVAGLVVSPSTAAEIPPEQALVQNYCLGCHNTRMKTAGLALDAVKADEVSRHPEVWEKVVRRLSARQMPPQPLPRPEESVYNDVVSSVSSALDAAAAARPNPGRTDTFRRLNRTEYQNAIRDLLTLDVDVSSLLPPDESSHGFDNVTVGDLSPTLLDRYISAAEKISRLAVGQPGRSPGGDTIRLPPDLTQEEHQPGLPLGTRGGVAIPYTFPMDAEYEIQIRLTRDRNEKVEGLRGTHQLELLLDRARVKLLTVAAPTDRNDHQDVDRRLKARIPVKAGPHVLGVTFLKTPSVLQETARQPYEAHFNMHRHPRLQPAVFQISINGPYEAEGPGDTPSRRLLFVCQPETADGEAPCAQRILGTLMRRAYRRPVTDADLSRPLAFYRETAAKDGFEAGIEMALSAVLVSPEFLFRIEKDPGGIEPDTTYPISDLQLASRLSFFLWSSIPDDELLDAAIAGDLRHPAVLERQVRRMLADERSVSLIGSFAAQWLHLRKLEATTPDMRRFPDFDDNLRQAFRRETELFFESIVRKDRSVLELLNADYTYVNERLAKHYGIPNIYGSRFRRIHLSEDSNRGGLLGQGSILTVTSYPTRTSPVIRGAWILGNFLGVPPPPPPADVPALDETAVAGKAFSVRERLAEHRANPACAGCHNLMDPVGFSMENFDAVGRWRTVEDGIPIDAGGGMADGSKFTGVSGLRKALLDRPEIFVGTVSEKLMTYALGRGVEYYDGPAIRKIVREARTNDYRFSSLVLGVATSTPFQMRRSQ